MVGGSSPPCELSKYCRIWYLFWQSAMTAFLFHAMPILSFPPAGGIGVRGFPCKREKCTFALCLPNAALGGVGSAPPKRGLFSCGRWFMIWAGRACQLIEKEKSPLWARAVMSTLQTGMLKIPLTCLSPYKGVYASTLKVKKSGQGVTLDTPPGL